MEWGTVVSGDVSIHAPLRREGATLQGRGNAVFQSTPPSGERSDDWERAAGMP